MIATVSAIVFPVFAIVALGFFYGRRHLPDMSAANRLNLEIFTPALIFSVLAGKDFQPVAYWELAVAAVCVVLVSGLLAWPVARWLGYQVPTFVPPMMFTNSGNMGLPLAVFAFGEQGLAIAVVLFMVENLLHFTLGNAMLGGRMHPLVLLRLPMLQGAVAGLAVSLLDIPLYEPLRQAIELVGQVSIPLMLFALGVRLIGIDFTHWRIGLTGAMLCPLAGIAAAVIAGWLLPLTAQEYAQLVLFGALPPAVLNYMLAEKFGQEPEKVAAVVLLGNLASVLIIPPTLALVLARVV